MHADCNDTNRFDPRREQGASLRSTDESRWQAKWKSERIPNLNLKCLHLLATLHIYCQLANLSLFAQFTLLLLGWQRAHTANSTLFPLLFRSKQMHQCIYSMSIVNEVKRYEKSQHSVGCPIFGKENKSLHRREKKRNCAIIINSVLAVKANSTRIIWKIV